jgi:DNA-binding IclR family transcriptional regulator
MTGENTTNSYSALEHHILDTLQNRFRQGATIADLAQATGLPLGTVRMGLQWLLACGLVNYLGECYRTVVPCAP